MKVNKSKLPFLLSMFTVVLIIAVQINVLKRVRQIDDYYNEVLVLNKVNRLLDESKKQKKIYIASQTIQSHINLTETLESLKNTLDLDKSRFAELRILLDDYVMNFEAFGILFERKQKLSSELKQFQIESANAFDEIRGGNNKLIEEFDEAVKTSNKNELKVWFATTTKIYKATYYLDKISLILNSSVNDLEVDSKQALELKNAVGHALLKIDSLIDFLPFKVKQRLEFVKEENLMASIDEFIRLNSEINSKLINQEANFRTISDTLSAKEDILLSGFKKTQESKDTLRYSTIILELSLLILLFFQFRSFVNYSNLVKIEAEQRRKAQYKNKMKSIFLANISHEIRTPISGVVGITDKMLEGKLSTSNKHDITLINNTAKTLVQIVNDILDVSKIESGNEIVFEKNLFNVREFVEELAKELTTLYQKDNVNFEVINNVPLCSYLQLDRRRLKQVINNLVSNAHKFTSKGDIILTVNRSDDLIVFEVKDTGIGIADDKINELTKPFFQDINILNKHQTGTGLGLFIVNNFVKTMKGNLTIESKENTGSTFRVSFDSLCAEGEYGNGNEKQNTNEINYQLKILVAEDNDVNRYILEGLLSEFQNVTFVTNGKEAVEACDSFTFDCVLMDIQMPVMNGVDAAKIIKSKSNMPIIALTANVFSFQMVEDYSEYFDDTIYKPVKKGELIEKIREYATDASLDIPNDRIIGKLAFVLDDDEVLTKLSRFCEPQLIDYDVYNLELWDLKDIKSKNAYDLILFDYSEINSIKTGSMLNVPSLYVHMNDSVIDGGNVVNVKNPNELYSYLTKFLIVHEFEAFEEEEQDNVAEISYLDDEFKNIIIKSFEDDKCRIESFSTVDEFDQLMHMYKGQSEYIKNLSIESLLERYSTLRVSQGIEELKIIFISNLDKALEDLNNEKKS
ncbi:ATP-binding protein [Vibrio sp. CyArs1]|uniref:ATP-binding protein n=1 Tax=Vibrio sp. CyArs1 TaxID=2682577 RepID=UPI001F06CD14|nr:ATP-binding protein [Vibrio sp. CyArs1]